MHRRSIGLLAALMWLPAAGPCADLTDPLPLRGQLPFHLPFLEPTPRGAVLLPPGQTRVAFHLAYENTLVATDDLVELYRRDDFSTYDGRVTLATLQSVAAGTGARTAFFLDGETMRGSIDLGVGVAERLELGLEVPVLGHTAGLFDSSIDGYHERFDLPDGGRPVFARDRFTAGYVGDDAEVFVDGAPAGLRPGDAVLTLRTILGRGAGRAPAVAASLHLKLPTGDAERLEGSGHSDLGAGVQVSKSYGRSALHGGYAYSVVGDWALAPALPMSDGRSLSATYGFSLSPRTALLAQVLRSRGPFPIRRGSDLGRRSMEIAIGFRHQVGGRGELTWAVLENLTPQHNTPDVGVFVGLGVRGRVAAGEGARQPRTAR